MTQLLDRIFTKSMFILEWSVITSCQKALVNFILHVNS